MNFSAIPSLAGAQKVAEKEPVEKLSTFKEAARTTLATDTLKQSGITRRSVRVPFSQEKAEVGGGPIVRGAVNITARIQESLVTGVLRVAGSLSEDLFGRPITLPGGITYEPEIFSDKARTQEAFGSMSKAALDRQDALDVERPQMPFRNTLQAATEEVFLPILDAVDFVGITDLAARSLARKTLAPESRKALDTLGIGLLEDSSEEGVRRQVQTTLRRNVADLESGKITPEIFVKKQNEVGAAIDTLTTRKTRFGELGTQINRFATAMEAERGGRKAASLADSADEGVESIKASRLVEETKKLFGAPKEAPKIKASTPQLQKFVDEKIEALTGVKPGKIEEKTLTVVDDSKKDLIFHGNAVIDESVKVLDPKKSGFGGTSFSDNIELAADFLNVPNSKLKRVFALDRNKLKIKKFDSYQELTKEPDFIREYDSFSEEGRERLMKEGYDAVQFPNIEGSGRVGDEIRVIRPLSVDELMDLGETKTGADLDKFLNNSKKSADTPPKEILDQKKSKLAQRLNETLPEGSKLDEFYDVKHIKDELEKAAKEIEKDPVKALTDALDPDNALSGRAAKIMEFAQAAIERGDTGVQQALLSKMRVLGTEIAQGLNMFKAFGLRNPQTDFMESVVKSRMNKFVITADDIKKAGTPNRAFNDKIIKPTRAEIKSATGKAFKVEDAQKLLDSLIC